MNQSKFYEITNNLLQQSRKYDFAGYDPFDGLNSNIFQATPLYRWPLARLAWLQFHKRSPINFRKPSLIPRRRNPKGVALFVLGMMEEWQATHNDALLEITTELGNWLLDNRCDANTWQHSAWGYHFDWEARAFYVPVGTPNAITTCYVAMALYSLADATGDDRFLSAAIDTGKFIDTTLFTQRDGQTYYAYIPGKTAFVQNANLWASALVAKSASLTGSKDMRERALTTARQSVDMQAADGSWTYGTLPHHHFIDGFHTGYNLEALKMISDVLKIEDFNPAIQKGFRYYKRTFLEPNGAVKYYDNSLFPIDMHSIAQAIITLLKVGGTDEDLIWAEKISHWGIKEMYLPSKKRFRYQKHRFYSNNIDYSRWTQAWSYYSFSLLNRCIAESH